MSRLVMVSLISKQNVALVYTQNLVHLSQWNAIAAKVTHTCLVKVRKIHILRQTTVAGTFAPVPSIVLALSGRLFEIDIEAKFRNDWATFKPKTTHETINSYSLPK